MKLSVYLDTRAVADGGAAPLKITVRQKGTAAFIPLDIRVLPAQWNAARQEVVRHPNAKRINLVLSKRLLALETAFLQLAGDGGVSGLSARELRDRLLAITDPEPAEDAASLFRARFVRFMDLKSKPTTRDVYAFTLRKLEAFDGDIASRKFEDITRDYLQNFEDYCSKTEGRNTRNIHLRNIRAVFNDAIDAEVTSFYPFRKYPIRPERTRKKALTAEQLRRLASCDCEPYQEQYRDIFLLMFMLRGINIGDLLMAGDSDILEDRLDYRRNKVGTLFSVKIEPEAMAIIMKYKGKRHLLRPLDEYKSHKDYLHHLNDALKEIGRPLGERGKVLGKGWFPDLSSNWARHTWATIASRLDIPKEVISKGLGHSFGLSVTDIYIDFDNSKVDEANRRVIDYVLYGKDYRKEKPRH